MEKRKHKKRYKNSIYKMRLKCMMRFESEKSRLMEISVQIIFPSFSEILRAIEIRLDKITSENPAMNACLIKH